MTRIGLISDTHSWLDERVFHHFENCDEIWHAGDIGADHVTKELAEFKPLRAVFGNIDGHELRAQFPLDNRFEVEGTDVWITHIGGRPGRYDQRVREELKKNTPDIFICGHSHILKVQFDKSLNMLHLNPGAAGKHGFHQVRTLLRFELENSKVKNLEVIELGKRGALSANDRAT
ncbi:metallophosphoesterase family protein [Halocola ammonii]